MIKSDLSRRFFLDVTASGHVFTLADTFRGTHEAQKARSSNLQGSSG